MSRTELIHVCDDCAPGLANDDWTHVTDDDEYASIMAAVEALGFAAYHGPAPDEMPWAGYFRCPVCGYDHVGPGVLFEVEAA